MWGDSVKVTIYDQSQSNKKTTVKIFKKLKNMVLICICTKKIAM